MRVSIDVAVLGEINAIKKENEKYWKYKDLNNRNSAHVGFESKCR
jgi:hypothetical protein